MHCWVISRVRLKNQFIESVSSSTITCIAHHFIIDAEIGLMPLADIPLIDVQADAQSAPNKMQPAVTHSLPDQHEGARNFQKSWQRNMEVEVCGNEWDAGRKLVAEVRCTQCWASSGKSSHRRHPETDLISWVQWFATYTSVMSFPESVLELLAYMTEIIRAGRKYRPNMTRPPEGRQHGQKDMEPNNITLHAVCFTGKAQDTTPHCSTLHINQPHRLGLLLFGENRPRKDTRSCVNSMHDDTSCFWWDH